MRLDKYLKVSRIIKRRTLAKEVCEAGKIQVNDRVAKAGTDIKPGDVLTITFGARRMTVEVLATPETVRVADAKDTYRIISDTRTETE